MSQEEEGWSLEIRKGRCSRHKAPYGQRHGGKKQLRLCREQRCGWSIKLESDKRQEWRAAGPGMTSEGFSLCPEQPRGFSHVRVPRARSISGRPPCSREEQGWRTGDRFEEHSGGDTSHLTQITNQDTNHNVVFSQSPGWRSLQPTVSARVT